MSNRYLYGLDISLKNTGITVYDFDSKEFVFVDSFSTEKIRATKEFKNLHLNAVKMHKISEWLEEIIQKYPPTIVAIEKMFSRFQAETQTIAKATGVIQERLWYTPQYLYAPKEVKAKVIHGNASKEDVANAIKTKYNDIIFKNDDESDSFAVALTFLIDNGFINWEKPKWADIKKLKNT